MIGSASLAAGVRANLISRIVPVALWLTWGALVLAHFGSLAWPLDLFAHFRVQYCVLLAVLAAAALVVRQPLLSAVACAGLVFSVAPILRYVSGPAPAIAHAESFRLMSLNIWFRNRDVDRIARYLAQSGADVIVLQEASGQVARRLQALLPMYPHTHIDSNSHGAMVLSRWPLMQAASRRLAAGGSQAAHVQLDWQGRTVTLFGVHLHWPLGGRNARVRNEELAGLARLARATEGPVLVAGDFNVTPWSAHFQRALSQSGLSDCALGQGVSASWPSHLSVLGIRIDHCLASQEWRVLDLRTGPHVGSDHRALIVDLALR